MKHIVFLLCSYHPYYCAVGKCLGNIATELEKRYKVTVICEKNIPDQADRELLNTQTILRVTTGMHHRRCKIDSKVKSSKGLALLIWKLRLLCAKLERYIKTVLSRSTCDRHVVRAYMDGLAKITEPIDVIIPTCNPFETVVAAMRYRDDHPEVQIVPYLFDLFSENTSLNRGKLPQKIHWKANMALEKQMFEAATCVFHVANWTKHIETYFPEYQHKAFEVEHPLLVSRPADTSVYHDNKIHIVYTGVVDTGIRNPEQTLRTLSLLPDDNVCIDFYCFGSAQNMVERYAAHHKIIKAHGQVDTNTAAQARGSAHILLSIGNTGNTSQMPSKIIEYFASGKPIIHFAQNADDPSIALLRAYPYAKIVDLSSQVDVDALDSFIQEKAGSVLPFDRVKSLFQTADPEYIANEIAKKFESELA